MLSRPKAITIGLATLTAMLALPAIVFACSQQAYLSASPSAGPAGSPATVNGSQFLNPVVIHWDGVGGLEVGHSTAGAFSIKVRIPVTATPQTHYLVAVSGGQQARAVFLVTPVGSGSGGGGTPHDATGGGISGRSAFSGQGLGTFANPAGSNANTQAGHSAATAGNGSAVQLGQAGVRPAGIGAAVGTAGSAPPADAGTASGRYVSGNLWSGFGSAYAPSQPASVVGSDETASAGGSLLIAGATLMTIAALGLAAGLGATVARRQRAPARSTRGRA